MLSGCASQGVSEGMRAQNNSHPLVGVGSKHERVLGSERVPQDGAGVPMGDELCLRTWLGGHREMLQQCPKTVRKSEPKATLVASQSLFPPL